MIEVDGNTYPSIAALARTTGLSIYYAKKAAETGTSKNLKAVQKRPPVYWIDSKGFSSFQRAAKAYGICHAVMRRAIDTHGTKLTMKQIEAVKRRELKRNDPPPFRHSGPVNIRGREFKSINAAARWHQVCPSTMREALATGRTDRVGLGRKWTRPVHMMGKDFGDAKVAAEALGISEKAVRRAIDYGSRGGMPARYIHQ